MRKYKKCSSCKKVKPLPEFGVKLQTKDGLMGRCKECQAKYRTLRYISNPKHYRNLRLKQKFGIEPEDYDLMYIDQDGRCEICGIHQSELPKKLAVDHDHSTGQVRGLLCQKCNSAIGLLKEDPILVTRVLTYLINAQDKKVQE